jgi:hypothetical protein
LLDTVNNYPKMKRLFTLLVLISIGCNLSTYAQVDSTATEAQPATPEQPQQTAEPTTQGSKGGPAKGYKEAKAIQNRIFFGGGLGLQFGSVTYIEVSPIVGYRVTEKLSAGAGLRYIYSKYNDDYFSNLSRGYETSIYGWSVFGRYFIIPNLFAHAEFEMLNLEVPTGISSTGEYKLDRDWISSTFVGGGYAQPLGGRSAILLSVLWNLTEETYTPYSNPLFRVGITVGL